MRLVKQRTKNDCGIAALAMIAGVEYAIAHAALFGPDHEGPTWTDKDDMIRGAAILGVTLSDRLVRCVHPENLNCDALVRTNPLATGNWHWVVWDSGRRKILDPLPYKRGLSPISQLTVLHRGPPSN